MSIMKPIKSVASISTLCVVLALSSIASVQAVGNDVVQESSEYRKKNKHMMSRMIKMLSLSEQQQVQIKAIKQQTKEQNKTLRVALKEFKGAEKLLLQAEAFDEKAYIALHESYQQTFGKMALSKAKTKHAIFNVLTTEQQEKWLKKMAKRKKRFKQI